MFHCNQLKTLLWKHFKIRFKKPIQLCAEIVWPLFLFIVLIVIKASFSNSLINQMEDCYFEERSLPSAGIFSFYRSFFCSMDSSSPCFKRVEDGLQVISRENHNWTVEYELRDIFTSGKYQDFFDEIELFFITTNKVDIVKFLQLLVKLLSTRKDSILTLMDLYVKPIIDVQNLSMIHKYLNLNDTHAILNDLEFNPKELYKILENYNSSEKNFPVYLKKAICNDNMFFKSQNDSTLNINDVLCNENFEEIMKFYFSVIKWKETMLLFQSQIFNFNFLIKFMEFAPIFEMYKSLNDSFKILNITKNISALVYEEIKKESHPFQFRHLFCGPKTSIIDNSLMKLMSARGQLNFEEKIFGQFSKNFNTSSNFCKSFFKGLKFLQPLFVGKILYTPDNEDVNKIINEAKSFFKTLIELKKFLENLDAFLPLSFETLTKNIIYREMKIIAPILIYFDLDSFNVFQSILTTNFSFTMVTDTLKSVLRFMDCFAEDRFVSVPNEHYLTELALNLTSNKTFLAGLVFDIKRSDNLSIPFMKYKIRLDQDFIDFAYALNTQGETKLSNLQFNARIPPGFIKSGFVYLQDIIEHAFLKLYVETDNVGTVLQQFPSSCYTENLFIFIFIRLLPLFMVISWLILVPIIVKDIVKEKELKLKDFIKVMGITNLVQWLAWFIHFFTIIIIPTFLLCFLLKFGNLLGHASFSLLFVFMLIYMLALITLCFMCSVFFNRSNTAAAFSTIFYFITFLPYRLSQNSQDDMPLESKVIASFSFTSAFGFGCSYAAKYEALGEGIQWDNIFKSPEENDKFSFGYCMLMLIFDAFLHILIMFYVEAVSPGSYGIAKPWYFPFNCFSKFLKKKDESDFTNANFSRNIIMEQETHNLDTGVSVVGLVKKFEKLIAVNNLNVDFYKNQITGFLGHNGAGKTTTMSIITGLYSPTSGTVYVNDMDVRTQIKEIRKSISLCPQHNILYDDLTVMEHLLFYSMLKGLPKDKLIDECNRLLNDLDLNKKMNVKSAFLSGGMKRKLSIGIAYIGSPDVVVLDEPTAGVDAYARRSIWDLIQKYKKNRTTILSTHLMDEADILSDRLVIINRGQICCSGSIMFLKKQFGKGYHLNISFDRHFENDLQRANYINAFNDVITIHVPNATLNTSTHDSQGFTFFLPYSDQDSERFHNLFSALNSSKSKLQFANYGLSDTTLEQVFNEANKNQDLNDKETSPSNDTLIFQICPSIAPVTGTKLRIIQSLALLMKRFYFFKRSFKTIFCQLVLPPIFVAMMLFIINFKFRDSFDEPNVEIHPWLIKSKESHLVTFLARNKNLNWDTNAVEESILKNPGMGNKCMDLSIHSIIDHQCKEINSHPNFTSFKALDDPSFNASCDCLMGYKRCGNNYTGVPPLELELNDDDVFQNLTNYDIQNYLVDTQPNFIKTRFGGIEFHSKTPFNYSVSTKVHSISKTFLLLAGKIMEGLNGSNSLNLTKLLLINLDVICPKLITDDVAIVWFNYDSPVAMVAYSNVVHNAILRSKFDDNSTKKHGMVIYSHPLNATYKQRIKGNKVIEILPPVVILFSLSIIPGSFLFFLLEEKNSGMTHLQFISGINSTLYWITNLIWDYLTYFFTCLIFFIIFIVFDTREFISINNAPTFVILVLMYGWAVIPLTYYFIWVFVDSNTGYIFLSGFYFLVGLVPTIVTFVIDFIPGQQDWSYFYQSIFAFIPQFCLGRGLIELSRNYIDYNAKVAIFGEDIVQFKNPFNFYIVGKYIFSLFIFGCFSFFSFFVVEFLSHKNFRFRNFSVENDPALITTEKDEDVLNEEKRIFNEPISSNILAATNLIKFYEHDFCSMKKNENSILAVNDVTFGVLYKECFGLLGVNGAGKTTLFKILTGDIQPTSGDIYLKGSNITQNIHRAQNLFGYCPQFDALCNLMTVEEHLILFSKLRGASSNFAKLICQWGYSNLDLLPSKDTLAMHLSGGNKRKLSIALALIGSPEIVYLDEPTAGIDPRARKYVWECIIGTVKAGQSVVLTSHSLEECEFLCNRITIMVAGQFKCLGTIQHLKNKFNEGYTIDAKLKVMSDENLYEENYNHFLSYMNEHFPEAKLLEHHINFVKFQLPPSIEDLSLIFKTLSMAKTSLLIDDYSINQTTLEQIFLSFAKQGKRSL